LSDWYVSEAEGPGWALTDIGINMVINTTIIQIRIAIEELQMESLVNSTRRDGFRPTL